MNAQAYRFIKPGLTLLVLAAFLVFSVLKVNAIHNVYKQGNSELQNQMAKKIEQVRSGEIHLDNEKMANLMEATTRRDFEDSIVYKLLQYVWIFAASFVLSTIGLIVADFMRLEYKRKLMNSRGGQ